MHHVTKSQTASMNKRISAVISAWKRIAKERVAAPNGFSLWSDKTTLQLMFDESLLSSFHTFNHAHIDLKHREKLK